MKNIKVVLIIVLFCTFCMPGYTMSINVQSENQQDLKASFNEIKLKADDGAVLDQFGRSVSLSGNRVLIGAHWDRDNGPDSGSAYIYDFNGVSWEQTTKLLANDGSTGDEFGYSVSLFGDRALIGAFGDDDMGVDTGSVYVFDFDGQNWIQTAKIFPSDVTGNNEFGRAVSLENNRALIGASESNNSGSAYVFDFDGNNWLETAKLVPEEGGVNEYFGWSVSLSTNRALIGSYGDNVYSGSAYIFALGTKGWSETTKLTASDGATADHFGISVSLEDDRALIGSYMDDTDLGFNLGSAYVFELKNSGWVETVKLTASDADYTKKAQFGSSVSLLGNQALIGAQEDGDGRNKTGSAYLFKFKNGTWNEVDKLTASDGDDGDRFGVSVSLSGKHILIGAKDDRDNGGKSGSAYVFVTDLIFVNGFD